jgi:hypothetical protein
MKKLAGISYLSWIRKSFEKISSGFNGYIGEIVLKSKEMSGNCKKLRK